MKQHKDWRMSFDIGEVTEGVGGGGSAHSPILPLLHLPHSLFSSLANPSVASSMSQLIIQPFSCFTYITAHSPTLLSLYLHRMHFITSPGELPMPPLWWFFLANRPIPALSMHSELASTVLLDLISLYKKFAIT